MKIMCPDSRPAGMFSSTSLSSPVLPSSSHPHQSSPTKHSLRGAFHHCLPHRQPAQPCSELTASFHHRRHKANAGQLLDAPTASATCGHIFGFASLISQQDLWSRVPKGGSLQSASSFRDYRLMTSIHMWCIIIRE